MIVLAWFTLMTLIILFSFGFLAATFWHWYKEAKLKKTQMGKTGSEGIAH